MMQVINNWTRQRRLKDLIKKISQDELPLTAAKRNYINLLFAHMPKEVVEMYYQSPKHLRSELVSNLVTDENNAQQSVDAIISYLQGENTIESSEEEMAEQLGMVQQQRRVVEDELRQVRNKISPPDHKTIANKQEALRYTVFWSIILGLLLIAADFGTLFYAAIDFFSIDIMTATICELFVPAMVSMGFTGILLLLVHAFFIAKSKSMKALWLILLVSVSALPTALRLFGSVIEGPPTEQSFEFIFLLVFAIGITFLLHILGIKFLLPNFVKWRINRLDIANNVIQNQQFKEKIKYLNKILKIKKKEENKLTYKIEAENQRLKEKELFYKALLSKFHKYIRNWIVDMDQLSLSNGGK